MPWSATAWLSPANSRGAGVHERQRESERAGAGQYKRSRRESAGGRNGERAFASAILAKLAKNAARAYLPLPNGVLVKSDADSHI